MEARIRKAVLRYWTGRTGQSDRQRATGVVEGGSRGEVLGGQHLDGFCDLICELAGAAGFAKDEIRFATGVELPGFYRPTKKWDVVVVRAGRLCAAVEMKSQVGPSFGNNFNNRTEEAVGSSVDLWRAYKEGTLGAHPPWVGYFFFLEKATGSTKTVAIAKTPFVVDPVFKATSYAKRYEILCRRMVLDRNYNAAALIMSERGTRGDYEEPSADLSLTGFARALFGHLIGCI